MTTLPSLAALSDREVLTQLDDAVEQERHVTARVVALLMEVDARKLYAQQSCSSLFTFCVKVLHFSEHAAYLRIEAARAARRFPVIHDRLAREMVLKPFVPKAIRLAGRRALPVGLDRVPINFC